MRKIIVLAIGALLISMPARADTIISNTYKGCYIAMMDTGEKTDEKYCIRLREFFMASNEEDRLDDCLNVVAGYWNTHNHRDIGALLPDRVTRRVVKGCAMMVYNVSEDVAEKAWNATHNH